MSRANMARETYYEVLKVRKQTDANPEDHEDVVFTTPHRSIALLLMGKLNGDLSPDERQVVEFRFAQRSLVGSSEKDRRVD